MSTQRGEGEREREREKERGREGEREREYMITSTVVEFAHPNLLTAWHGCARA